MTVAPGAGMADHGAGTDARRSPKGRSASPGTRPGVECSGRPRDAGHARSRGPKRRGGSGRHGQLTAAGTGFGKCRGWSSYAVTQGLTNRHILQIGTETRARGADRRCIGGVARPCVTSVGTVATGRWCARMALGRRVPSTPPMRDMTGNTARFRLLQHTRGSRPSAFHG